MPRTTSATKALRQSLRRKAKNTAKKMAVKAATKKFAAANNGKAELGGVYAALDKAAKTGVIHRNKAARLKSRLSKKASAHK